MWLISQSGFYSAVENHNDSRFIHVRSRWREDLENLEEALKTSRLESTFDYHPRDEWKAPWNNPNVNLYVQETPEADYPFRMDVTREEWEQFLKMAAAEIDYTNFKDRIYDNEGNSERLNKYYEVWAVLREEM